jgi:cytochrome c oxidase subunit 2
MWKDVRVKGAKPATITLGLFVLAACRSDQSVLHPASEDARSVAMLFWAMTAGGAVIWLVVMAITVYAVLGRNKPETERFADRFILVGGVVFPTVVLAALLIFGLRLLPGAGGIRSPDLTVHVTGEQFWWRVIYETPDGQRFETANQIRLPLGKHIELHLTAHDVIHSFWIPPLGGKLDMIPGRINILRLTPDQLGTFRGVCAEFCGMSHALMAFEAVVEPPEDFALWLASEAAPAAAPTAPEAAAAFIQSGCGACHQVRGIVEKGAVGPDLTHLASRATLAAGTLPMTRETLAAWLDDPQAIKPDARMPGYADLTAAQREAILNFLMGLK